MKVNTRLENALAFLLTSSVIITILFMIVGGSIFLLQHGNEAFNLADLVDLKPTLQLSQLFHDVIQGNASAIIFAGIFILLLSQILRVGLLAIYYAQQKDMIFLLINGFVFAVLVLSLFG